MKDHQHFSRAYSVWILFMVMILSAGVSSAQFIAGGEDAIPGQYIVTYKPNVAMNATFGSASSDAPSAAAVAGDLLSQYGLGSEQILHIYENAIEGFAVRMEETEAKALAEDPRVLMVEQDGWGYAADVQQNPTWGLDRVDQKDLPLSNSYTYNTKASNVHVYVLDTGLYDSHTEFSGRVGDGYDAVGDGNGTLDQHGHGTHCAGTVLGTKYGVAKGAIVHPVQILDSNGSGQWSQIAAGADWVAKNHKKPAVASMSLQGTGFPTSTVSAINGMINAGVVVIGAAGNYDVDACTHIMGATNAMIAAASNSSDNRWTSSNWGSCVDIFAPGENVTSASHTSTTGSKSMSGTSMATPHVAGAAALYLADNPNATPSQVQKALLDASSANKINDVKGSPNKLLYTLFGGTPPPPPPPQDQELKNGQAITVSGQKGEWKHYFVNVPSGSSNLVMKVSGGTGDADLYTKFGSQPTSSSWDCRPYKDGNAEECTVASPQTGKYYVSLYAYSAFSSASVVASYDSSTGTKYRLTINKSGEGTVTLDPPGGSYDSGTRVKVTATAASGWKFTGWSGDLTGTANPSTITMNGNKTVTATFQSDSTPNPSSCVGNCGGQAPGGCWCDSSCATYGDCCADKTQVCGAY